VRRAEEREAEKTSRERLGEQPGAGYTVGYHWDKERKV